jgi:hypothetical protein
MQRTAAMESDLSHHQEQTKVSPFLRFAYGYG